MEIFAIKCVHHPNIHTSKPKRHLGQIARRRNQIPVAARQPPHIGARTDQIEVRRRQRVERLQRQNQQLQRALEFAARLENEREIVLHVASAHGGGAMDFKHQTLVYRSKRGLLLKYGEMMHLVRWSNHLKTRELNLSWRSETGQAAPASEMRCWRIDRARVMTVAHGR